MQEGTTAFLQMVKITSAVVGPQVRAPAGSGLSARPHHRWSVRLVGLAGTRHLRRTRRLVGFLGPRVYEALYGNLFPTGVQTSENLYACGLIDVVTPRTISATWWTAR